MEWMKSRDGSGWDGVGGWVARFCFREGDVFTSMKESHVITEGMVVST